ncbi:MAG TPA: chloride channel protein [Steroidobacteraceae bacterium]|nr:chloride channel protein [Steroidobacteraceae bacterium]
MAGLTNNPELSSIPPTLRSPGALPFWAATLLTGIGAGAAGALLMKLLYLVQYRCWPGPHLIDGAARASVAHHLIVLLSAGAVTGGGQILLRRLSSGNSIDITEAITNFAGRLPALRTLGTAVLSVVVVGMGASLGREGAPKQAGAVIANLLADRTRLSDEQRRLIVACGAGAGMAAAYGVPLGGALFAVEVLRGVLALRLILPALLCSAAAAGIAWLLSLPNEPTYLIPSYPLSPSVICWSLIAGPIIGLFSVGFIRAIEWADRNKPKSRLRRLLAPILVLGVLGALSIVYPQLLGNGKDVAALAFTGQVPALLMLALLALRPLATVLCLGSGVPGGLFTPSLATGALLGGVLGAAWSWLWPGAPPGLCAIIGSAALLAATTHGPISSVVLVMELTGRDRSFILPMILAVVTATVVARTLDPRSIYDARFSDAQVREVLEQRKPPAQ